MTYSIICTQQGSSGQIFNLFNSSFSWICYDPLLPVRITHLLSALVLGSLQFEALRTLWCVQVHRNACESSLFLLLISSSFPLVVAAELER